MLQTVDVGERSLDAYRGVAPEATLDRLIDRAKTLRAARVLHINATPYRGGVAELLRSVVPLLNELGLVADWKVAAGTMRAGWIWRCHSAGDGHGGGPAHRSGESWP